MPVVAAQRKRRYESLIAGAHRLVFAAEGCTVAAPTGLVHGMRGRCAA
jgi:hypothetical protein